ncbi:MAG: hydroxymethylbilane synthase [Pirellulales bacterium]|nr:hydroxymethylbilane synthase [Pirellulales bacterium]
MRLGTRASALARRQAEEVAQLLRAAGREVEIVLLRTQGDRRRRDAVAAFGGQGVFTREIQAALLERRIDLAVHSLKDLPTEEPPGLTITAVPERAPCGDVLISEQADRLENLPPGSRIGTGSLRRRAQLLHVRPDLQMADVRGNVETRLGKLRQGFFDALVLAEAGLIRLELEDQITQRLPLMVLLPAVGQGALAIETRSDDAVTRQAVAPLDHPPTHAAVLAERTMLATLHGGCLAPVAAWGRIEADQLRLTARVLSPDGRQKIEADHSAPPSDPVALGRRIAEDLLRQGAAEIIRQIREA